MASLMEFLVKQQKPKVSPYIEELLQIAKTRFGENSSQYQGIYNQYFLMPVINKADNFKHYEANLENDYGLKRLYKRVIVLDLTMACASECVYCIKGYYSRFSMSKEKIIKFCEQIGNDINLKEVLITGGDPFMAAQKLKFLITELIKTAANIKYIRIGTRLPVQNPDLFDPLFFDFFHNLKSDIKVEIGCQINHPFELQPKTIIILNNLVAAGVTLYSQNVLLKGVNNSPTLLIELYDQLRYLNVFPYYLFHAVPLKGTDHLRTSVEKGLELISILSTSGEISGRAKPLYTLMTDIGKIPLYQGMLAERENNYWIVNSSYNLQDRLKWNPNFKLPHTAFVRENNLLSVKYLDGSDN